MKKGIKFVILVIALAFNIPCVFAEDVKIITPDTVAPNEKFRISIEIAENPPVVVGVILSFPDEFTFINCSAPYKIRANNVSLAIINNTEVECMLKASASEGLYVIKGKWADMLNGEEGVIEESLIVGKITHTITTTTPTDMTPTVTTVTQVEQTPGFEFMSVALAISLIIFKRWLR